ncbi:hypothetical protein ACFLUC_00655 [Chloroflexota bacterium]
MDSDFLKIVSTFRAGTYCLSDEKRVRTIESAINFVNQRGFIFFWPIKGVILPSLWVAVAGDRPVANAHDDPGHVTWGWKDSLLGKRKLYYSKILRKKATMISLEVAPYFYALTNNFGSPDDDYLTLYEQGVLTRSAKLIYEALLRDGPMDTISLRRAVNLTSRESDSRFNRAMLELQNDFKILPVGISQAGGWRYAFIYDIVASHYPDLPDLASEISESDARRKLVDLYICSLGAVPLREISRLFQWNLNDINKTVNTLVTEGKLRRNIQVENQVGEWIASSNLLD